MVSVMEKCDEFEMRLATLERVVLGDAKTQEPGLIAKTNLILDQMKAITALVEGVNKSLEVLNRAVMGDPALRITSLAERQEDTEEALEALKEERDRLVWLGRILIGVGAGNLYLIIQQIVQSLN